MNQAYTNFDYLEIQVTNDSKTNASWNLYPVEEITLNKSINLGSNLDYYYGKFTSVTTFSMSSENCVIYKIVGIKI